MSKLASVYAQSLFEIALEENIEKDILQEVKAISEALKETPEFVQILSAPMIEKGEKLQLIDTTFKAGVNPVVLNYLKVLTQRKDANCLEKSLEIFEELYNEHYNIEKVIATTAIPLDDVMSEKLVKRLEEFTGKSVVLTNQVDENCLGGVVLSLRDTQIDGTVLSKIKTLKQYLLNTSI